MNFKYLIGAMIVVPLLPFMYFQGKKIRSKVPKLPEAKGAEGKCDMGTPNEIKLMTIGESTIAGVGVATHEEGFTGILAKAIAEHTQTSVVWKVYAKSGFTAASVAENILPQINEPHVDLIVIGLGGNDAFKLHSPAQWTSAIRKLIAELQAKYNNTPIVFANMPPIKEFPAFTPLIKFVMGNLVEILGEALKKLAAETPGVYFSSEVISLSRWSDRIEKSATAADFFSDGVHPSPLTYRTWAIDLAQFIIAQKILPQKKT